MRLMMESTLLHELAEYAVLIGLALAALGYAFGTWRRGKNDEHVAALAIAGDELELLKASRDRMALELRDSADRIAKLEVVAEELQRENAALRELVMLEQVPPALQKELDRIADHTIEGALLRATRLHEETRVRIVDELREAEARVVNLLRRGGIEDVPT